MDFASISFIRIRVSLGSVKICGLYGPLCPPKWFAAFAFTVRRRHTDVKKLAAGETSQLTPRPAAPAPLRKDVGKAHANVLKGMTGAIGTC
jgi:hypothetical protein